MQKTRFRFLIIFIYVFAVCLGLATQAASTDTEDNNVVFCKGHGTVSFQGDGTISINGDGILVVNDEDAVTFTDDKELECFPTEDGSCIYIGIDDEEDGGIVSTAKITGENLEVSFTGANIGIKASGNATLVLKGYGIYIHKTDISFTAGRWTFGGATITIEN